MEDDDELPPVLDYRTPEKPREKLGPPAQEVLYGAMRDEILRLRFAEWQATWAIWLRILGVVVFLIGIAICVDSSSPSYAGSSNHIPAAIVGGAFIVCAAIFFIGGFILRGQAELIRWAGKMRSDSTKYT